MREQKLLPYQQASGQSVASRAAPVIRPVLRTKYRYGLCRGAPDDLVAVDEPGTFVAFNQDL
jgi:hypothetical protein